MADVLAAVGDSAEPLVSVDEPYERLRGRLLRVIQSLSLAELLATNLSEANAISFSTDEPVTKTRLRRSKPGR